MIINLHLSFPVRSISSGTVIGIALTRNKSPLDVETLSSLLKLFLDVTKTEVWFPRRPQSWRIQNGALSGIAVCSTKTVSEARRLVYLVPNPAVGDRFYNFK